MNKSIFDRQKILSVFSGETPVPHPLIPNKRCAAVAMIFNETQEGVYLCFGLRAKFDGDPWSGDMAFPGGKAEAVDKTFHDIAARETFEEVGLHLNEAHLIGSLDPLETFGNEKRPSLLLKPMIYRLNQPPQPLRISNELEAAFWIPTSHLWEPQNWVANHVEWRGRQFPGIRYQQQVIWGLTLRILMTFGQKMNVPFPIVEEA